MSSKKEMKDLVNKLVNMACPIRVSSKHTFIGRKYLTGKEAINLANKGFTLKFARLLKEGLLFDIYTK